MLYDMRIYSSKKTESFGYFCPFDCRVQLVPTASANIYNWTRELGKTSDNSTIFYFLLYTLPNYTIEELLAKGEDILRTISSWIGTTRVLEYFGKIYTVRILGYTLWYIKDTRVQNANYASCLTKIEFLDF